MATEIAWDGMGLSSALDPENSTYMAGAVSRVELHAKVPKSNGAFDWMTLKTMEDLQTAVNNNYEIRAILLFQPVMLLHGTQADIALKEEENIG